MTDGVAAHMSFTRSVGIKGKFSYTFIPQRKILYAIDVDGICVLDIPTFRRPQSRYFADVPASDRTETRK
jgi:hypothetical protein